MKRITTVATAFFIGIMGVRAQSSSCSDVVAYVGSKNVGSIGNFHLSLGHEEKAAQTYRYSGSGKVNRVRVYGSVGPYGGAPLRVHVYAIDPSGRPKQELSFADGVFWSFDNAKGYVTINLPDGGTYVESDFAIGVTLRNAWPFGNEFKLSYTGDGEGLGQDLASVAGTSTGYNWTSAIDNFDKDGDFYLVPEITHFLSPNVSAATHCLAVGSPIQFENLSAFTKDSMFNRIFAKNYSGSAKVYSWSFGDGTPVSNAVTPSHTYSTAGAYNATLTVAVDGWTGLCTNSFQFPISVGLSATASNVSNLTCYGANNGVLNAVASGGTSPYQYSLDGLHFQGLNTFGSLASGVDTLIVRDALGCLNTSIFSVQQPSEIQFQSQSTTNANCGSTDGAILVSAVGGTGTLLYRLNNGTFQNSGNFSNLAGGSYTVTVKDANSCTQTTQVQVNNFGSPTLSLISKTAISCHGASDGSIQLGASGGTGLQQFSVNGGITYQSSGTFTGLPAGNYPILVRDAAGCVQGTNVTLQQPLPITFNASTTASTCADISDAKLTVFNTTGGIGTYSYSIGGSTYQSNPQFNGLSSGTYTVYVRDAAGCTSTKQFTISPTQLVASTVVNVAATCYGRANGSFQINATGGNGDYMYRLNGFAYQYASVFDGLTAGTYTYSVRDKNNCTVQSSVVITQPSAIQASITSTSATCGVNNGGLLAVASGGSGSGYTYSLDGTSYNASGSFSALTAGTYFVRVKDGSSCEQIFTKAVSDANGPVIQSIGSTDVGCHDGHDGTITINSVTGGTGTLSYSINGLNWATTKVFTGLTSGTYTAFVKDVNGCIGSSTITIIEPDAFTLSKTTTSATCHGSNNGTVKVVAAGGSGTLAYSIDNGETYQASNTFSNLMAGMYKVTVRDIAGCTGSIYAFISEPTQIAFNTGVLNVTCHGDANGVISVNAGGGSGNFQYSLGGNTYQTSSKFIGLSGGMYAVYVRDANNCTAIHYTTVLEPDSLILKANIFDVSCAGGNNGAIDLMSEGGSGRNLYRWSTDSVSQDLFDLTAGIYSVEVTDQNGCFASKSFTLNEPDFPLVINAVITWTDSTLGGIDATVTGGTTPYEFEWSNGANSEDIKSLTTGTYNIIVTDANGCVSTGQFTVQKTAGFKTLTDASAVFELYPNPASHQIHVEWKNKQIGQLTIYDVNGRIVHETFVGKGALDLNVQSFQEGMYYIRVFSANETAFSKFNVVK